MKSLILVDTSLWVCALRRNGFDVERTEVFSLIREGTAAWCDVVRLELWRGVSSDYDRKMLTKLAEQVPCLPIDATTWKLACELANVGRANGQQFPSSALVIFSCSHQHRVVLRHRDKHFAELETLIRLIKNPEN